MRFYYLIAAYNEAETLPTLVEKFNYLLEKKIDFQVYILDNASNDDSADVIHELKKKNTWLHSLHLAEKGMGLAFAAGLKKLDELNLSADDWVVFNAADLPFAFSDFESVLTALHTHPSCGLFIGSKQHSNSVVARDMKRKIFSYFFLILRKLILNLNVKDTQGTVFMRAKHIPIFHKIRAHDYFFTTELIYFLNSKTEIVEVPVVFVKELRPSKVNVFVDGYKSLKQLIQLRLRSLNEKSY